MAIPTAPFDPMDHLDTVDDQIALLNDALATRDPGVIGTILGMIATKRGITHLSRDTGIGRSSLYKAIGAEANPTLDTLLKMLDGLGLALQATAQRPEPALA